MRVLLFTVLLSISFASCVATASETYTRTVHMELDAIDGATAFELEIKNVKSSKVRRFKVKDTNWSGKLPVGSYEMKTRALDYRGVPGEWSEPNAFDVGLEKVVLVSPAPRSLLPVDKNSEPIDVEFRWKPVPLARHYQIEVASQDGKFSKTDSVSDPQVTFRLPLGLHYQWKVTALGPGGLQSQAGSDFDVAAGVLSQPKIQSPENPFVREIHWDETKDAQSYDVEFYRRNSKEKKWEPAGTYKDVKQTSATVDPSWKGGVYRVDIRAKGEHWQSSKVASKKFKLKDGDRSPAAEFESTVRESIDHLNGWYGVMAYMVTDVSFAGSNFDGHPTETYFDGLGGTGRVGGGYQKSDHDWGVFGIVDLSGLKNGSQNFTYASAEASAVWRKQVGSRGEFRSQMGLFYKEIPVAEGDASTGIVNSYDNAAMVGPHIDGEYWYSFTPKFGFQANVHIYETLMTAKTPNGQGGEPSTSTQYGLAGSYRVTTSFTGLLGVSRRDDELKFKSTSGGQTNAVSIQGTYLSLYAEYGF